MKKTKCKICRSLMTAPVSAEVCLVKGYKHNLIECPVCKSRYFDPLPGSKELNLFYNAGYYGFNRAKEEGKGYAFASKLRRIKKNGRFLDVGCATGYFINGVKQASEWEVYGTDYSTEAVKYARKTLRLDVRQGDIKEVKFKSKFFDYIHVNNVLEHVNDPAGFLAEIRRIIKDHGVLLLSVPNGVVDSADIVKYYNEFFEPAKSPNGHLYFLPKQALLNLLDSSGFKVTFAKTYGFKRGLRSLGFLSMKSDWKNLYIPTKIKQRKHALPADKQKQADINKFESRLRFFIGSLKSVIGLHKLGLDFILYLKPK